MSGDKSSQKEDPILRFSEEGILYRVKVLGTTAVSSSRGDQICEDAMQRIKVAGKTTPKQDAILSISLDGLTFSDYKTKKVIAKHPIALVNSIFHNKSQPQVFGFIFWIPCMEMNAGYQFKGIETEKPAISVTESIADLISFVFDRRSKEIKKDGYPEKAFVKGYLKLAKDKMSIGKLDEARLNLHTALGLEKAAHQSLFTKEINDDLKTIDMIEKWVKDIDNLWSKKEWRAVIFNCSQILEKAPSLTDYKLKRALAMIYNKQVSAGGGLAVDVLRNDAMNVDALFVRGLALFYEDKIDKAMEHFKQALIFAPDHANSMSYFKKIKSLKQKKEEAFFFLNKDAPTKSVKDSNVYLALKTYNECLEIEPLNEKVNARLHFNISICHGKLDHFKMSLDACNQAIALDSEYEKAFLKKVHLLFALKMFEKAVREAEFAYEKFPSETSNALVEEARNLLEKSNPKDYYDILGVDKSANEEEIKKAYKKMAMVHHPDRHSNAVKEKIRFHEKKFKDLKVAYEVLSDKTKREQYDSGQDIDDE